jgi:hypothetical protein
LRQREVRLAHKNLAEITAADYPGERLMICYNPVLEEERKRKREALPAATEKSLEKIGKEVTRRKKKALTPAEIGLKVGKVLGRYKMGKHLECKIGEGRLVWSRRAQSIEQEEKLDGIYVLRTSEPVERLSAEDTVRSYKRLAEVERAFRCLKGIDLLVRPIRHRTEDRVPAHIFCACWPTMWNGICAGPGRRRYSKTKKVGGTQASRSDSAGETLGLRAAQEALAGNCRWSSRAQLRELAAGVGQPGPRDLRAQIREGGRKVEFDFPPGARANAGAGAGLRIDPDVRSNRKVNSVLSLRKSAEYSFGPQGTSA